MSLDGDDRKDLADVTERLRQRKAANASGRPASALQPPGASGMCSETSETDFYSEWDAQAAKDAKEQRRQAHGEKGLLSKKERDEKTTLLEAQRPWAQRARSFQVRVIYTVAMIATFLLIILSGHLYCSALVLLLTCGVFHEIIRLKRNIEKDNKLPFFFFLRWYFFLTTVFFVSRRFLSDPFEEMATSMGPLAYKILVRYNTMVSYMLFVGGMVAFVISLRKFTLRYQFHQIAWTTVTLMLVVVQACAQMSNIYNGLIWFVVPSSLVICNDITAYLCGFFFGRTPLIALSPKKTWEGFLGGSVFTMLWGMLAIWIFSKYQIFMCPQPTLLHRPFGHFWDLSCETPNHLLEETLYELGPLALRISTLQIHGIALGAFASIIAPFGGFFASGLKRAFKIKDFGDSIPGHGGITDRFDCQILMGMFTYSYFFSFVAFTDPVEVFAHKISAMPTEDRQRLLIMIQDTLQPKI